MLFFEVDHATSAAVGGVGFAGGAGRALHALDQSSYVIPERVAVVVQVASGARLAVEAHGVPPSDVGELAGKFAHGLRIVRSNDALHSHGDVAAARGVHVRPDGIGPIEELKEVPDTLAALEDG